MDHFSASPLIATAKAIAYRSRNLYTPVALLCIGYLLIVEHESISIAIDSVSLHSLLIPLILIAIAHGFIAICTQMLFRALGNPIQISFVLKTHINRLPARYLPGGIWQTVSRAIDFSVSGIATSVIIRVMLLEMAAAATLAGFIGTLLYLVSEPSNHALLMTAILIVSSLGLILMPWLASLRLQKKWTVNRHYLLALIAFSIVWLLYGTAFFLFMSSALDEMPWAQAVGIYLVAWLAGFLAFFAPQGIGVFELTTSYLVKGDMTFAFLTSVLAFRILCIFADLTIWGSFQLFERLRRYIVTPTAASIITPSTPSSES